MILVPCPTVDASSTPRRRGGASAASTPGSRLGRAASVSSQPAGGAPQLPGGWGGASPLASRAGSYAGGLVFDRADSATIGASGRGFNESGGLSGDGGGLGGLFGGLEGLVDGGSGLAETKALEAARAAAARNAQLDRAHMCATSISCSFVSSFQRHMTHVHGGHSHTM